MNAFRRPAKNKIHINPRRHLLRRKISSALLPVKKKPAGSTEVSAKTQTETMDLAEHYNGIDAHTIKSILDLIQINLKPKEACERVGINPLYFAQMVKHNVNGIADRFRNARLTAKILHLQRIHKADKHWQASAWFLERVDRDTYGKEMKVINTDGKKQVLRIGNRNIEF